MDNVLVTGGCGFIGSHIVEELYKQGYNVYVIDNLSTGSIDNIKNTGAKFIGKNISEINNIDVKFDYIFHQGFPSSSPMYKSNRFLINDVIHDILIILEYAKKNNTKIIIASTSSLYNGNPIPWKENMPIYVTDFYTEARYYVERLCELYSKLYGIECISLRYFSVFGEREEYKKNYANVLTQMIWAGLKEEEFIIYGDGNQTRDLIYVKDVVKANIRAMMFDNYSNNIKFEVFNVGTGKAYSFNDMIRILSDHGLNIKVKYIENPIKNYVYHTLADITKSENLLKFKPTYTLENILPQVIEYYREKIKNSSN